MKTTKIIFTFCFALLFVMCKKEEKYSSTFDYHFHENMITSDIPADVDTLLYNSLNPKTVLDTANWANLAKLKRVFNIYSWQSLLAINWPVDEKGNPKPNFNDEGDPEWMQWKEYYEVFRCNGEAPTPWGSDRIAPKDCNDTLLSVTALRSLSASIVKNRRNRILFLDNKNFANETGQAFAQAGLKDKNGNLVYYEILLNHEEYDYINKNTLYNLDGQAVFANQKPGTVTPANFPSGKYGTKEKGAIEVKLAWRVLEPSKGDDISRYITTNSLVLAPDGKNFIKKVVGLVGFHISQKPTTCSQWAWSTFEHVDNLNTNTINAALDGKKAIQPSFYKTYEPTRVTDTAQFGGKERNNVNLEFTQCERRIEIPADVAELNKEVREILKKMGSKWQYYELIDTQFPTDPSVPPTVYSPEKGNTVQAIENKSGGRPTPSFLTNITMESYFQKGNQFAIGLEESGNDKSRVFGTESCIGCHSSADICTGKDSTGNPLSGGQLSADFSWLLNQKAHWKKTKK